jgi:hypothetical protein
LHVFIPYFNTKTNFKKVSLSSTLLSTETTLLVTRAGKTALLSTEAALLSAWPSESALLSAWPSKAALLTAETALLPTKSTLLHALLRPAKAALAFRRSALPSARLLAIEAALLCTRSGLLTITSSLLLLLSWAAKTALLSALITVAALSSAVLRSIQPAWSTEAALLLLTRPSLLPGTLLSSVVSARPSEGRADDTSKNTDNDRLHD